MFFYLGKTFQDNLPVHTQLDNGLCLSTDPGWQNYDNVIYKGLSVNYCKFICDKELVKIEHDATRGFPLYYDDDGITNLEKLPNQLWASQTNIQVDGRMQITSDHNKIVFQKQDITDSEIVDAIHHRLCNHFEEFVKTNKLPIKVFLSGGIDSLLMWAYLDHYTKDYELVDYEYLKYDEFYVTNQKYIVQNYWAYRQIHYWNEPCVLVSGGHGDEYLMRGPYTSSKLLASMGIDILAEVKPEHYMYMYLNKPDNIKTIENSVSTIKSDCHTQILDWLANDHQHWHLGETLTFTPYKDLEILRLAMQSSPEQLLAQAIDASVSKELVRKLDPRKLDLLAKYKNESGPDCGCIVHKIRKNLLT